MKYKQLTEKRAVLRLDPGDDFHKSIEKIFHDLHWDSGLIWGLGSVENPVLAHYKITRKQYTEMPMIGIFEVASLNGTVAQANKQLSIHLHVVISDEQMRAFGGHLVKGKCSATAELVIFKSAETLNKKLSDESGLKVWDF